MVCAHCQSTLPDGSRFCLSCGADLSDPGGERRAVDTVADIQQQLRSALAGHYQVRQLLGRGGMGTVFLADDLKLERPVAIKVLPPRLAAEDQFVARFVREARTSAKLDHPNIIPIYAVHSEGDLPYFVMKYVAGRSLDDLIAQGPLDVDTGKRILAEAAAALAHAHRKGVIHRDVKPSNIMIDESGHVLLADFGISKALESSTAFTGTGHLVGTPAYMSPEQTRGLKVDGRSDQYSLAVVGFQVFTGQQLFQAGTPNSALYMHVHEPPRSARELRPEVPEPVAQALLKALSKNPDGRFATMDAFAAAICPELADPSTPSVGRLSISVREGAVRRRRLGIGATVGVAAVLGLAAVLWPRPGADPNLNPAGAVTPPPPAAEAPRPPATDSTPSAAVARQPAAAPVRSPFAPGSSRTVPVAVPATQSAPAAVGYASINATPYGTLSIDGVDVGDTPVSRRQLATGPHVFRITRDGYRPWTETITIEAGNLTRRSIRLIPEQP